MHLSNHHGNESYGILEPIANELAIQRENYPMRIMYLKLKHCSLEAYMQEIGCAGCTGLSSHATLYYNNSDIRNNEKHTEESMKS